MGVTSGLAQRGCPFAARALLGEEIDTAGDGFLAIFDAPARAIRCAVAIREALEALTLDVRAGVHTGEVERRAGEKP